MAAQTDAGPGRARLMEILLQGLGGRRPAVPVEPRRLAVRARQRMDEEGWAYVAGSAGRESSARANRRAFDRWRVLPRMMRGVERRRDLSVKLFGETLSSPLLLAPIGVLEMAHRQADLAVARAAATADVPMIFSSQSSVSMEDCAAVMGDAPRWFQLYWGTSDDVARSFVERAEKCGCKAIVLTVDTTMLGWRPRDLDQVSLPFLRGQGIAQYTSDPVFRASLDEPLPVAPPRPPLGLGAVRAALMQIRRYPGSLGEKLSGKPRAAVQRVLASFPRPELVWTDIGRLREMTSLPVLIKGVLCAADARLAVEHGADGLIVSNHGGRQVDGTVGALDVLPEVVDAVDVPVLFDSGIRCGADVFKALALGASAVCLGRPFVYGLAIAGEKGVGEVLRNTLAELDVMLALCGLSSVAEIGRDAVVPAP